MTASIQEVPPPIQPQFSRPIHFQWGTYTSYACNDNSLCKEPELITTMLQLNTVKYRRHLGGGLCAPSASS